jgi:hypothetical protein
MRNTQQQDRPQRVRLPVVAGSFYPADPDDLRKEIARFLLEANREGPIPKGLISPHAGYPYSGAVAASGYALLEPIRHRIERVLLMGPSHRVPLHGLAVSRADAFATPLGTIPVDPVAIETLLSCPQVQVLEEAHRQEHSLEVHLPMLQMSLDDFSLVPIVIGQASAREVAEVINSLWDGDETLLVVSSDLSHYHDWQTARAIDHETSRRIEHREWQQLDGEQACGYGGIRGLLKVAAERGLRVKSVDLRNSGDTQGGKDRVVGYGCYVVY